MATGRSRGRPAKLTDHQAFTLRLPKGLYRELKVAAASRDVSLNDLLIEVIDGWWSKQPKRKNVARLVKR